MFVPLRATRLAEAETVSIKVGGAESNVAIHFAELGYHAMWSGKVGDDPFGVLVLRKLEEGGVDTSLVKVVSGGRTGIYVKDPDPAGTTVYYFRNHSVARDLGASMLDAPQVRDARIIHLTGITPALSDSASDLVLRAVSSRSDRSGLVSFDVNYRAALWPVEVAGPLLHLIASQSDICFVGLDEAELLWGCTTAESVREILSSVPTLVVKDGAIGAHSFGVDGHAFVPSLPVEVVEPVGAGDAFAAGYLAGALRNRSETFRLRLGHLLAAQVLGVMSDHATLPPWEKLLHLCELTDIQWSESAKGSKYAY